MMTFRREVSHKLRVLQHAERHGDVSQTCRYFGIGRASFYRWKSAFERYVTQRKPLEYAALEYVHHS